VDVDNEPYARGNARYATARYDVAWDDATTTRYDVARDGACIARNDATRNDEPRWSTAYIYAEYRSSVASYKYRFTSCSTRKFTLW